MSTDPSSVKTSLCTTQNPNQAPIIATNVSRNIAKGLYMSSSIPNSVSTERTKPGMYRRRKVPKPTAVEYINIARELLRPVGRTFIPCQFISGNFHVNVNKIIPIDI
ncbi:hypothetical protein V8G54_016401 [Vigna mungo]|uniref:Uncharacterized protein n=1 Tax=Vigna mungo TaxID=3915 RepID=A0AAQ3NN17_VIGMU